MFADSPENPEKHPFNPQRFLSVSAGSPVISISLFIKAGTQTDTDAHTQHLIGLGLLKETHCCQACSHHALLSMSVGMSTDFSQASVKLTLLLLNEVLLWISLDLFQCINTIIVIQRKGLRVILGQNLLTVGIKQK